MCGCLSHTPCWGPGLQLRHVPWLGIKPATLCFTVPCSIHWAAPARAWQFWFIFPTPFRAGTFYSWNFKKKYHRTTKKMINSIFLHFFKVHMITQDIKFEFCIIHFIISNKLYNTRDSLSLMGLWNETMGLTIAEALL